VSTDPASAPASSEPARPASRLIAALLLLITTVAVLLLQINWSLQPNYGYDEAWHVYLAGIGPGWKFLLAVAADPHPPIYYLLLRPFVSLGLDPIYPRLLSIIPAALTIPLLYALLRKLNIRASLALLTVMLLATAISFEQVGITVRSYSLTVFFLLAALWFWADLFPDSRGRPSRLSTIAALTLFALAFGCLYAAAFVSLAIFLATLLVMLAAPASGALIRQNLRRYSSWPEWLLFVTVHLLGVSWFFFTWVRHINLQTPSYLSQFARQAGQPAWDFIHQGLRLELALFTPLDGLSNQLLDLGLLVLLAVIIALTVHNLRRGRPMRALLSISPLLVTMTLALLGVLDKYPFGGAMRHQYILFPLLLLLIPLLLDALWGGLRSSLPRRLMLVTVVVITVASALQQFDGRRMGEAPDRPWFADEFALLFERASDKPILLPSYGLIPAWINRRQAGIAYSSSYQLARDCAYLSYQGWFAAMLNWPSYDVYSSRADDGGPLTLIKSQYHWDFPPVPDDAFFIGLRKLLGRIDQDAIRVFAFQTSSDFASDPEALRQVAARNGFTLGDYTAIGNGAIWDISLQAEPATSLPNPTPTTEPATSP